VLSLAGNFSTTCDGHLVAVEKEDRYKTQTLSIVLKANRKGRFSLLYNYSAFTILFSLSSNAQGIKYNIQREAKIQ